MKRRKALMLTASIMGSTIIGSELFLSGCSKKSKIAGLFSDSDVELLDEVGEVILPETELSPGAKHAKIGVFMKLIVTDCYSREEQKIFANGIKELNQMAKKTYSKNFLELQNEQKHDLLARIDNETRDKPLHFFQMMKQLSIWGYFTSQPGATKALRYNPVPGKFIGCVPYKKGDKAWA